MMIRLILASIVALSLVGVIGVQESFATAPIVEGTPISTSTIDKIPRLNESFTLSYEFTQYLENFRLSGPLEITVDDGFEIQNNQFEEILSKEDRYGKIRTSFIVNPNMTLDSKNPISGQITVTAVQEGIQSFSVYFRGITDDGRPIKGNTSIVLNIGENNSCQHGVNCSESTAHAVKIQHESGTSDGAIHTARLHNAEVNLNLSNLPKVGETAELAIEVTTYDEKSTWPGEIISVGLTSGVLEFVDIPTADISHQILEKWGDRYTIHLPLNVLSQNQTDTYTVTIKAVTEGIGRIGVSALDSSSSLPIGVTLQQGLMIDDYYELFPKQTPEYLSSIAAAQLTSKNTGPMMEPEPLFPNTSPKKQLASGVTPEKITCYDGFELIFKPSDNSPACVKPSTAEKLIERGWKSNITESYSRVNSEITQNNCKINGGAVNTHTIKCIGTENQCSQSNVTITTCSISGGNDACESVGGKYVTYSSTCWDADFYRIIWDNDESKIIQYPSGLTCGAMFTYHCILENNAEKLYVEQLAE